MSMKLKRMITLILALLMVGGTFLGVFATLAHAADETVKLESREYRYPASNGGADDGTWQDELILRTQSGIENPRDFDVKMVLDISAASLQQNVIIRCTSKNFTFRGSSAINVPVSGASGNKLTVVLPMSAVKNASFTGNDRVYFSFDYTKTTGELGTSETNIPVYVLDPETIAPDNGNNGGGDDNSGDNTKVKSSSPRLIIEEFSFGGTEVSAGQTFPLTVKFKNTHFRLDLTNILLTVTASDGLQLSNSTNTLYMPYLAAESTVEKTFNFTVRPDAEAKPHVITFKVSCEYIADDERKALEPSLDITIPVVQKDRFHVDTPEMPVEIYPMEEYSMEVTYINKGKGTIYNLSAEINGSITNPGQKQNIGNVLPGATNTVDFALSGESGQELKGDIIFTYEDALGNIKTISVPYETKVMVMDMNPQDPGMMNPDVDVTVPEEKPGLTPIQITGIALAGVAVVAIIVGIIIKKRKAAAALKEDDDENI